MSTGPSGSGAVRGTSWEASDPQSKVLKVKGPQGQGSPKSRVLRVMLLHTSRGGRGGWCSLRSLLVTRVCSSPPASYLPTVEIGSDSKLRTKQLDPKSEPKYKRFVLQVWSARFCSSLGRGRCFSTRGWVGQQGLPAGLERPRRNGKEGK